MIIESSPAAFQVMTALLDVGAKGATREHLVHRADIGTSTFYRAMKPLMDRGIVTQEGNRYHLPLSNWYNYRFKLWHDAERLGDLDNKDRSDVMDILQHARLTLGDSLKCLWLVGSAAHQQLQASSDLDFLAVVDEETLYHPAATRPLNFVTVTTADFGSRYEQRDGFVLAALQYGILLFDRDFAQPYYANAIVIEPAERKIQDVERTMERQRKRLLEHVADDEEVLAAEEFQRMSVSLARLMLQTLGVLPAGKPHLLALANLYFGPRFHGWLQRSTQRSSSKQLLMDLRQWSEYKERFFHNLSHLKTYARLPYAKASELAQLTARILQELMPDAKIMHSEAGDSGCDIVANDPRRTYIFEVKSLEREVDPAAVNQIATAARKYAKSSHKKVCSVLIANNYRSVPVNERPALFSDSLTARAKKERVRLTSAIGLLRAHNQLHIDGVQPEEAMASLEESH